MHGGGGIRPSRTFLGTDGPRHPTGQHSNVGATPTCFPLTAQHAMGNLIGIRSCIARSTEWPWWFSVTEHLIVP